MDRGVSIADYGTRTAENNMAKSKISTRGLTAAIRKELAGVRKEHPRTKSRIIEPAEAPYIGKMLRKLLSKAEDKHTKASMIVRGGVVNSSYSGLSPKSDEIRIEVDLKGEQGITVHAERTHARRGKNTPLLTGRLMTPQQSLGTLVITS